MSFSKDTDAPNDGPAERAQSHHKVEATRNGLDMFKGTWLGTKL